ncbi:MAG: TfoX/Sxy family protein [Proteobacteria bacterium]|nr:TfoX/Sxy family protein [Pseudomonadota bacterium]
MAADPALAATLRHDLATEAGITEQRMFGALMLMKDGHLLAGASARGQALFRVGPAEIAAALALPGVEPAVMGARVMKGFVALDAAAEGGLRRALLAQALSFVASLPPR